MLISWDTGWIWPTYGVGPTTRGWDFGIGWRSRRIVEPEQLPFTVAYVRDLVLRSAAGPDVEDEHIENLIQQAVDWGENYELQSYMLQTWELRLTAFPSSTNGVIELPRPPLVDVTQIEYVDADGTHQMLGSPELFQTLPSGDVVPGKVAPLPGTSWPSTRVQEDAVIITYRTGVDDPADMDPSSKAGVLRLISELYRNRELAMSDRQMETVFKMDTFFTRIY